jgi:hypothetical protein
MRRLRRPDTQLQLSGTTPTSAVEGAGSRREHPLATVLTERHLSRMSLKKRLMSRAFDEVEGSFLGAAAVAARDEGAHS